ncbi:MAG: hypothetical protein ACE37H_12740 [Phycisphaeraceae bacterium]
MKIPQKLEPYQRSRHRARLHAWVVAATAVASIGVPALAGARGEDDRQANVYEDQSTPSQAAHRVAADWLAALGRGDHDQAIAAMRLPREPQHERVVLAELDTLATLIALDGVSIQPVAHRHAGHWALSAWRIDTNDGDAASTADLLEPITLYNPAADGLIEAPLQWEVVPQGLRDDAALAPLYNADHDELIDWYHTLS